MNRALHSSFFVQINHLIRTVPSDIIESQLSRFDAGLRSSLESIIHSSIPDLSWKQATLPVRLGGLGLRESTSTAPAAFLASCNSSYELVLQLLSGMQQSAIIPSSSLDQGLSLKGRSVVEDRLRTLLTTAKIDVLTTSQHQLQSLLDSTMWHSIKDNTSLRDHARLNTISAQHAGAWLWAIPNPNTGLAMPHREFVVSLHIWLGIPLSPADLGSKRCSCGQILDKFGDHLLGCSQNNIRTRRHDALFDVLFHALLVDNGNCRRNNAATLILVPDRVIFFILTLNKAMPPILI